MTACGSARQATTEDACALGRAHGQGVGGCGAPSLWACAANVGARCRAGSVSAMSHGVHEARVQAIAKLADAAGNLVELDLLGRAAALGDAHGCDCKCTWQPPVLNLRLAGSAQSPALPRRLRVPSAGSPERGRSAHPPRCAAALRGKVRPSCRASRAAQSGTPAESSPRPPPQGQY